MDAVKYLKEKNRMTFNGAKIFETIHNGRRKSLGAIEDDDPEKAVEIVEKWSAENPEKTILQDFLEKYPDAPVYTEGQPRLCPQVLGYFEGVCTGDVSCKSCWNRPLEG